MSGFISRLCWELTIVGKTCIMWQKTGEIPRKIYFAPWDMDITWGDALSAGTDGKVWDVGMNTTLYSERINWSFGDRLIELDVEGSRSYVEERWKELREGVLSDESLTRCRGGPGSSDTGFRSACPGQRALAGQRPGTGLRPVSRGWRFTA